MRSPIIHIKDNIAVCNNGSIVVAYSITYPEVYSLNSDKYLAINSAWNTAIKLLPVGVILHKFDSYIKTGINPGAYPTRSYFQRTMASYLHTTHEFKHRSYLFIIIPYASSIRPNRFVNPFSDKAYKSESDWFASKKSVVEKVEQSISALVASGYYSINPLTQEEARFFNFQFFNLMDLTASQSVDFSPADDIKIGENYIGALSLTHEKAMPDEIPFLVEDDSISTDAVKFDCAIGDQLGLLLQENHYYTQTIIRQDTEYWKKRLNETLESFKGTRRFDPANEVGVTRLEQVLTDLNMNQVGLCKCNITVTFWDSNKEQLKKKADQVSALFTTRDIFPYRPVSNHLKQLFIAQNPFYTASNTDLNFFLSDIRAALSFFTTVTNYREDVSGHIFFDRFGFPRITDIRDEQKKYAQAQNMVIVAPTGSGKSNLANSILIQHYEAGAKIVIIDIGKSFDKFTSLFGEEAAYIKFEAGQPLGYDIFNAPPEMLRSPGTLITLRDYLLLHLGENERKDVEMKFFENLILLYLENNPQPSFRGLLLFMMNSENLIREKLNEEISYVDYKEVRIFISDFIEGGKYEYLYRPSTEKTEIADSLLNKRIVTFELDSIRDNPLLLPIVLKVTDYVIETNIWNDKKVYGVILRDEFARQLRFKNALRQTKEQFEAIRKQNGSIIIILQTLAQLPEGEVKEIILENAQIRICLENSNGHHITAESLKLGDVELMQLNSIKNNFSAARPYSEFWLKRGSTSGIYRSYLPEQWRLAFATDGPQYQALESLRDQGLSTYDAIEKLTAK